MRARSRPHKLKLKKKPPLKKGVSKRQTPKKIDAPSLWQLIFDIIKANVSIKLYDSSWLVFMISKIYAR